MLFKKEKKVIELIINHIDKVEECLLTVVRTLQTYLDGDKRDAKTLCQEVDALETQADFIYHDIRNKLYSGAYLPLLKEEIYKLVESIDKVANAGEACCDFFLNQRPEIPDSLNSQFLAVIRESMGIVAPLKEAVLCFLNGECSIEVVRRHAKAVGLKESDVDKIEWDLTKAIFTSSLDYSHKIHLKLCLDTIVEVSDRAEDAAEQLELVTLKSMF